MENWEKIARSLKCGSSVRVKCCQNDRSQLITHSDRGYSTYCFRCGSDSRKFKPHGARSLQEMLQHKKQMQEYVKDQSIVELPDDFTLDIPDSGLYWFLKTGIQARTARHYGFGWSSTLNRVVMPVYSPDGDIAAIQCRSLDPTVKPKYLNKSKALFWSDPELMLHDGIKDVLVITEDILSAVKVGRVCRAVSSLGTSISSHDASELLKLYNTIYVWYDGDTAGLKAAPKVKTALELQGARVRIVRTPRDPKTYTNEEIREILT